MAAHPRCPVRVGLGHWARVTQGRVTQSSGRLFPEPLSLGGPPAVPAFQVFQLAALRGALVNFIGLFHGPGSVSLVNRSRRLPQKELGSCSPGLEEALPCTEREGSSQQGLQGASAPQAFPQDCRDLQLPGCLGEWESGECPGIAAQGLPESARLIPAPRAGREEQPCAEMSAQSQLNLPAQAAAAQGRAAPKLWHPAKHRKWPGVH